MSAETIIVEGLKMIGPVGGASVLTAYLFLKYSKNGKSNGNGNGNGNGGKLPSQCPLHSHLEDAQKTLFTKIDDLQKELSGLPFKIWEIIQKEK
jgi:hypothetical protein